MRNNQKIINEIEREMNFTFPKNYKQFMTSNNLEGLSMPDTGVYIFGIKELKERNDVYEVNEYSPNTILIAQEGDLGYFFNKNENEIIFSCDLGALGSLEMDIEYQIIDEMIKE